jgi:hypothetical protein
MTQSQIGIFGIWNIAGNRWVKAESGYDFKSSYEITELALSRLIADGSAKEGLEIRSYATGAIS